MPASRLHTRVLHGGSLLQRSSEGVCFEVSMGSRLLWDAFRSFYVNRSVGLWSSMLVCFHVRSSRNKSFKVFRVSSCQKSNIDVFFFSGIALRNSERPLVEHLKLPLLTQCFPTLFLEAQHYSFKLFLIKPT